MFHRVVIRGVVAAAMVVVIAFFRGDARALPGDLFNGDELQRLDILMAGDRWETLRQRFREDDYYRVGLRWNGITVDNVGIRSRGLGSRNPLKPGLRVDFGRFVRNQTFLGLRSIVLDNLAQDPSGLVERVAMRFYRRLGLAAPREAHARLYVNGDYAGLYALVESIDEDFIRRVFGSDGYLYEYEWESEWFFTRPDEGLAGYRTLFDPVTHKRADVAEHYAAVDQMLRVANDAPAGEFATAMRPYLDLPLFMRHVAAQNFLAQWDGILGYAGVNNFYIYRGSDSSRFQFILWDEDNAFRTLDYPVLDGHERNVLMRRAMAVPELRQIYFDSLLEAAASATEPTGPDGAGWLEAEIQRQRQLITPAMRADIMRMFPVEQIDRVTETLLEFARWRPGFVRAEVARITRQRAKQ
jgi:spore coat protein CotH